MVCFVDVKICNHPIIILCIKVFLMCFCICRPLARGRNKGRSLNMSQQAVLQLLQELGGIAR
jgi:hypothetical protein